ncbi:hypothetical protein Psed_5749 [Pseudonocardia dioxanivorans CB1190]|uniref:Uncharacterized protein n=1 Tax=Pseudonocardia dioxanivorans (strain ATCC 55486 / DSM 44775 / JCM 13855 / CB1190) TaxID=675635 RepID=F4D188_PSEUX|nr:hypothetical protein [Pseudonocardia dioxanivorans]AEA27876.1 hypothetical protein Psed_5749 [Pseudonocardia dioxanivorans CB1190]
MTAVFAPPAPKHRLDRRAPRQSIQLRRRVRRSLAVRALSALVDTASLTTALVMPALCLIGMALIVIGAGR